MKAGMAAASAQLWRIAAGTELRRNVLETYGTRVLVLIITFATAVVIARELGPEGWGKRPLGMRVLMSMRTIGYENENTTANC